MNESKTTNPPEEHEVRLALGEAKRIVVKLGSRSLAAQPQLPDVLARQFAHLRSEGRSIVLISSGAVALGLERLNISGRPADQALLQAAASAGQSELMRRYDQAFGAVGITCAQVLLTHGDLSNRKRVNNARAALAALIDAGAIPIINENDVVATDELRFTDNDQLSAMVAPLVDADALVLLTDVTGVLNEAGERISFLDRLSDFVDKGSVDSVGRGGMSSKLDAADKARRSGAAVVIASAVEPDSVSRALAGEDIGTCFPPVGNVLRARQHWIAYALRPRGAVIIDEGAATALLERKTSLLPVGVLGIRGDFRRGDSIRIMTAAGKELGRGLARLGSLEAARSAGLKGQLLAAALGGEADEVVVHRDDLVLWT